MTTYTITEALKQGKEIIIIPGNKEYSPAVWYMQEGTVYTWCRHIGLIDRSEDFKDPAAAAKRINTIIEQDSKSLVFVRGEGSC